MRASLVRCSDPTPPVPRQQSQGFGPDPRGDRRAAVHAYTRAMELDLRRRRLSREHIRRLRPIRGPQASLRQPESAPLQQG